MQPSNVMFFPTKPIMKLVSPLLHEISELGNKASTAGLRIVWTKNIFQRFQIKQDKDFSKNEHTVCTYRIYRLRLYSSTWQSFTRSKS